jgi:hypothetical protein
MSTAASDVMLITSTTNFTPDEKRDLLFNINHTLEIPMDDFNENWWPIVSNIWTQWNSCKHTNGDVRKVFACRFTKHQKSSMRQKENIQNEKRRITRTRPSGLCNAKIKVSWLFSLKMVKIERYKDSPNHAHSLLETDRIKHSQAVRTLVEKEAVKNYSPRQLLLPLKNMQQLS